MARATGQGHGRNDTATTDPQPRARLPGTGLRALGPQASDFGGSAWAGASRGLGPGPARAWGPGAWGPGPRAAPKSCSSL